MTGYVLPIAKLGGSGSGRSADVHDISPIQAPEVRRTRPVQSAAVCGFTCE